MSTLREALIRHPVARRLAPRFDPERLAGDLGCVHESWWERHRGSYHDGAWESVSLWAPRGDVREQTSKGGEFAATPALAFCPYLASVMEQLPGQRNRVRLMRLRPGGHIYRHSDPLHTIAAGLVRLHVPVLTNADVRFLVNDVPVPLLAGETWHVDVRFPHEVANNGTTMRVHLVLDVVPALELLRLLEEAEAVATGRLTGYYAKYALPTRLRRWLGLRDN